MDACTEHDGETIDLILFGATGNLAQKKLFPALYYLEKEQLLSPKVSILAIDRTQFTAIEDFFAHCSFALRKNIDETLDESVLQGLYARLRYQSLDLASSVQYQQLSFSLSATRVFYLAVPPKLYANILDGLASQNFVDERSRIVVEKPLGNDYPSFEQINAQLARFFHESQLYRIDHFLGKDTVLNLLALRFSNPLFIASWDNRLIDHVQISLAENIGIERRWNYYDEIGQLRDMVQNHLLQLLSLIAMEPPQTLEPQCIHAEKTKVLRALRAIDATNAGSHSVRGQYRAGHVNEQEVPGYFEEEGAYAKSRCETFVALKVFIDNWRWAGVPFYLRTGKRMSEKRSEILIAFKNQPHDIFTLEKKPAIRNFLRVRLQPNEGIDMQMMHKVMGIRHDSVLQPYQLDLSFDASSGAARVPDAYERLLCHALSGDQSLFACREEVALSWQWVDSLMEAWQETFQPLDIYSAGTWGPDSARTLIERDGRFWGGQGAL